MLTTTYANLDKLAVEHFTTCAAEIMLGNEGDAGTVTVALDDEPRDRSRPDITARVQDLLVYARALSPTAQVDKEFEEVRKFLAKLPRDEWVPCSDGDRHDELGRVEDAYGMITRESRMRGSIAAFEVALARYKVQKDALEPHVHRALRDKTPAAKERLEMEKAALWATRDVVVKYAMESITNMRDFLHVIVVGFHYVAPKMPEACQCEEEGVDLGGEGVDVDEQGVDMDDAGDEAVGLAATSAADRFPVNTPATDEFWLSF